jgi:thermitase
MDQLTLPHRVLLLVVCAATTCLGFTAAAHADGSLPASPFASPLASSQLIVSFRAASGPAAAADSLTDAGTTRVGTLALGGAAIVSVPALAAPEALATLQADPDVASVRIDPAVQATLVPNDPQYDPSHNPCVGSLGCWPYQELRLAHAWDVTIGSASVTVAVVDTGVLPSHEDLAGAVLPGYNAIDGTTNSGDDNGHGTEVAGMIAARGNNAVGVVGSCWACKILPVKVLNSAGSGYTSTVANGIIWATAHGAQVINVSIGGGGDPALQSALAYATAHGVFVSVAAGNNGSDWPTASYPGGYAASMAGVVSVGALDYYSQLYSFSNYGAAVEVAAPGCELTTAMDGGYTSMCGTSAASPQVAGAAALALSYNPTLSPAALEATIEQSANPAVPVNRGVDATGHLVSCTGDYPGPCTVYGSLDDAALLYALGAPAPPDGHLSLVRSPTITGQAQVGLELQGAEAAFSGAVPMSFADAWLRCDPNGSSCVAIGGATTARYTLVPADEGATIRFQTTARNGLGELAASSDASAPVAAAPLAAPVASGEPLTIALGRDGSFAAAQDAAAYFAGSGANYSYRWLRCTLDGSGCQTIAGAASPSYPAVQADRGHTLRLELTSTNAAGSLTLDSAAALYPLLPPTLAGVPIVLIGTVTLGASLTANLPIASYFDGVVEAYSYSWERCDPTGANCVTLPATGLAYTLQADDQGSTIRETVTAANSGGSTSLSSTASALLPLPIQPATTPPVPAPPVTPPSGGGGGGGGGGLPPDLTVHASGSASVPVDGQILYSVTVASATDASATGIHLRVTLPTGASLAAVQVTRGPGCRADGQLLDCNLDWLSPPLQAQLWLTVRFGAFGAFSVPFTVSEDGTDANPADNTASVAVAVTDPSSPAPASPGATPAAKPGLPRLLLRPTLTGSLRVGERLRATHGRWQGDRISYSYRFLRCDLHAVRCVTVTGTGSSYLLQKQDLGKRIEVTVSARSASGQSQATSFPSAPVAGPKRR